MKVLVAGATGAIGRELLPRLVERNHEVWGMTRTAEKRRQIEKMGAQAVVADALDADAVARAVAEAEPEVIIHEMTDLSVADFNPRKLGETLAPTNRLRTEGTRHLLAAGRAVGIRKFVSQSFAPYIYARTGTGLKSEEDPVDPDPPKGVGTMIGAVREMEEMVTSAEGIDGVVLRYGLFYGEGTSISYPDGSHVTPILQRKFPVVGDGGAVWSFVHVADAAEATVLALESDRTGIYNVVDDAPAPVSQWLPAIAEAVGAPPPRYAPKWVARLLTGKAGVAMMTGLRGSSNTKAKRELGWQPRHASVWQDLAGSVT